MDNGKIYSSTVIVYKCLMVQWSEWSTDALRGNKREREARDRIKEKVNALYVELQKPISI